MSKNRLGHAVIDIGSSGEIAAANWNCLSLVVHIRVSIRGRFDSKCITSLCFDL